VGAPNTPPVRVARTAPGRDTHNVLEHDNAVTVVFDKPYAAADRPDRETFELSWTGPSGPKKLARTRATAQAIDPTHDAIRLEGLKPGVYRLTRTDGRTAAETVFANVPFDHLTGVAASRRPHPHEYWVWLDPLAPAVDEDLKSKPVDFDKLVVAEPKTKTKTTTTTTTTG
jgi:hypothetical protein